MDNAFTGAAGTEQDAGHVGFPELFARGPGEGRGNRCRARKSSVADRLVGRAYRGRSRVRRQDRACAHLGRHRRRSVVSGLGSFRLGPGRSGERPRPRTAGAGHRRRGGAAARVSPNSAYRPHQMARGLRSQRNRAARPRGPRFRGPLERQHPSARRAAARRRLFRGERR